MNTQTKTRSWAIIFVFIFLVFASSSSAQEFKQALPVERNAFPFDFSDAYYFDQGVDPSEIMGRRNGTDGLSVSDKPVSPKFAPVRILVTIPAYDQSGAPHFWYPLGDIRDSAFIKGPAGDTARRTAKFFPIYVFPDRRVDNFEAFANARQAPIISDARSGLGRSPLQNYLGIREIFYVNYTEKAFGKEGREIMAYFAKKNGYAADDTPIIRSIEDLVFLLGDGFVTAHSVGGDRIVGPTAQYAISPMLTRKGAVAPDAFLWMTIKDGSPLVAEEMFPIHFDCLKKTGDMCTE
jgi:hypothetical protein